MSRNTLALTAQVPRYPLLPSAWQEAMMLPESILNQMVNVNGEWKTFSEMTDEDLAWTRAALERGEHVPGTDELRASLETAFQQSPLAD